MRLLILFCVFLIVSCVDQPAGSRYDKIAKAYCECTGQLAAMNEQAAALATDTNAVDAFQERLKQIQTEYDSAKQCAATIVAQFGKLKPAELDSVKTALAGKCGDMAGQEDLLQEMLGE